MSKIGDLLRTARTQQAWSLSDAERHSGVPAAQIRDAEDGRVERPGFEVLEPLAYAYGTSLGELIRISGHYSEDKDSKPGEVARLLLKPGTRSQVLAALSAFVATRVDGEPGTEAFNWHIASSEPDVLWLYELFKNMDGLIAHMDSEEHKSLKSEIGPMIEDASLHFFELALGKTASAATGVLR